MRRMGSNVEKGPYKAELCAGREVKSMKAKLNQRKKDQFDKTQHWKSKIIWQPQTSQPSNSGSIQSSMGIRPLPQPSLGSCFKSGGYGYKSGSCFKMLVQSLVGNQGN